MLVLSVNPYPWRTMFRQPFNTLFVNGLTLLAGIMDTTTGLLLIVAPQFTLALMRVPPEEPSAAFISFIGAFVLANGSVYLWAYGIKRRTRCWTILRHAWLGTAWVRTCVGLTTGLLILGGKLPVAWVSVPLSDLLMAAIQFYWIRVGRFPENG